MKTWYTRGCKKCGGDMYIDIDEYDKRFKHCLQCGNKEPINIDDILRRVTND